MAQHDVKSEIPDTFNETALHKIKKEFCLTLQVLALGHTRTQI